MKVTHIIAFAMLVIAANMTYSNFVSKEQPPVVTSTTHVVQVIEKVTKGNGNPAFLVQNGFNLELVSYDTGSMFYRLPIAPQYLAITTQSDGKQSFTPINY